jgi:hypothetical protein
MKLLEAVFKNIYLSEGFELLELANVEADISDTEELFAGPIPSWSLS